MENYNFYAPTRVLFGQGQLANLHTLPMPGKKAMIVTSNGQSTIKNGSLAATKKELEAAGCEYALFNKVSANPLKETVEEGAQFARGNGCDFVVALGGGSVMDAAKNMAMLAPQPTDNLWDYVFTANGGKKAPEIRCFRGSLSQPRPAPAPRWMRPASSPTPGQMRRSVSAASQACLRSTRSWTRTS